MTGHYVTVEFSRLCLVPQFWMQGSQRVSTSGFTYRFINRKYGNVTDGKSGENGWLWMMLTKPTNFVTIRIKLRYSRNFGNSKFVNSQIFYFEFSALLWMNLSRIQNEEPQLLWLVCHGCSVNFHSLTPSPSSLCRTCWRRRSMQRSRRHERSWLHRSERSHGVVRLYP